MKQHMHCDSERLQSFVLYLIIAVSAVLYTLQAFTPLRLNTDGMTYLSLADAAAKGGVVKAMSRSDFPFPKGYPTFAFLLMKLRIFSSGSMVFCNLLFLALGLVFCYRALVFLGFGKNCVIMVCLMSALSFATIKHVTQGMSDFLFFLLASCACWLMTLSFPYKWIPILVCIAAAVEVRFIGLALIVPFLVNIWPDVAKRKTTRTGAAVLAAGCLVAGILAGRHYLISNSQLLVQSGLWNFVWTDLVAHCQDFGELLWNAPVSKLPQWSRGFLLMSGGAAILAFFSGTGILWKRSRWLASYLIAYSGLIMPWPYTDPRFWFPALPFVLLAIREGLLKYSGRFYRRALAAYVILFCAAGFVALAYSTRITLAGPQFAYYYGDGRIRSAYLAGCSSAPAGSNQSALHLLREYEWHCRDSK